MVVGFTTTCAISATISSKVVSFYPTHNEVYSIQYYVIKFVSDLRKDKSVGFFWYSVFLH